MTSFFCVVSIAFHTGVPVLQKCMGTSRKVAEIAATHASPAAVRVSYRTNAVHKLPSPLVHLLYWQTCITILQFHSSMNSMGCNPSLLKKRMTERCSSLVHAGSGAASFTLLLRRRVAFLHLIATCRPLFKQWVSLSSTYKTIELCFEFLSHF
jgi:hypothetical protein